jgi:hypothetical protein
MQGQAQRPPQRVIVDSTDREEGDDLMNMLEGEEAPKKDYTTATFKSTRLINGHSIENTGAGVLDFRISHRFGPLNSGIDDFFGLDAANTRIGFDYGITDWLGIGIGRSTFQKEYDGFAKVRILRQTENNSMPVSISYVGATSIQTLPAPALPPGQEYFFSNRMFFMNQLLIARKFSPAFSLQLMPTHIHYNLVPRSSDANDLIAMGIGGRVKLSNRISLNAEYYYRIPGTEQEGNGQLDYRNSLSIGFDIETGGHVFQLMFTNATAMTERAFVGQSTSDWGDGGIHFGFNISRVFTIVRPKEFKDSRNKIW